jgi:hypothetical protein
MSPAPGGSYWRAAVDETQSAGDFATRLLTWPLPLRATVDETPQQNVGGTVYAGALHHVSADDGDQPV